MMSDTIKRFDKTVGNYLKYRPGYPKEIYHFLLNAFKLNGAEKVADIGSGTGFLSKLFLSLGHEVYGVEPNEAMRIAAETYLKNDRHFQSVNGCAENTTLPDQSMNLITAGTAFHWFDVEKTKIEFKRILKSPGYCLLVWNVRDMTSKLIQEYETLILTYCKDYQQSLAQEFDQTIGEDFFNPFSMQTTSLPNKQQFSWEGFKGRLLSTSYSLKEDHPQYQDMLEALKNIFLRNEKEGKIEFLYETKMYYGRIK